MRWKHISGFPKRVDRSQEERKMQDLESLKELSEALDIEYFLPTEVTASPPG